MTPNHPETPESSPTKVDALAALCPACHHPDHDPGACPSCPSCELHTDDALEWVIRSDPEMLAEYGFALAQPVACDHKGIGQPGCSTCDAREEAEYQHDLLTAERAALAPAGASSRYLTNLEDQS